MDYFCVDVETSGPTPGKHNLLSVGLTHVSGRDGFQPRGDLYVELRPEFPGFDPRAMAVHRLDRARLQREGLPCGEAMAKIAAWVEDARLESDQRPVFVAHNAAFDWMFVAFHFGHAGLDNPFGFAPLDTKALAMGMLGLPWPETTLRVISRIARAPHPDPRQLHHAGEDARHTARVFCALMERRARGDL